VPYINKMKDKDKSLQEVVKQLKHLTMIEDQSMKHDFKH